MADFFFPQLGDVDLVEVYEFCDEPVLFICKDRTDLLYLAVLSEETPSHKTWLLTALSPRRFSQLRAGAIDLYSALADAERGQVYRARLPRTPDGTATVEWVPSTDLTRSELPLADERLDPMKLEPLEGDTKSLSVRLDAKEGALWSTDRSAVGPSTVLLDNRVHGRVFDVLGQALAGASHASTRLPSS